MDVLGHLQVVELSSGTAGPIVGQLLADFGAEVIKVESPTGDPARRIPGFAVWNRGKHSVKVDPEDAERCRWLGDLIAGADVCLVSDLEAPRRYGLDVGRSTRRNPRLLVVQTPPYAGDAPWLGGRESNGMLAAALGVAWRQSSWDGGPIESVYPHLLYVHGLWAAVCAVAALVERERSGFGQVVTVTGAHAVLEANVGGLSVYPALPDADTAIGPGGRHPTYSRFVARDGQWLASGALGPKFEAALLHALGIGDMLQDSRLDGRTQNLVRPENIGWARGKVEEAFRTRDRDAWLSLLDGLGIPCGPLDASERWLDHQQVRAIGMRVEVDDPVRGKVVMPGVPIQLCATPGRVRGPAPRLGEHDERVVARAADPAPTGAPPMSRGPLTGFRILDLGTFVAAPYAGALLAELGADVVKVEPPAGDPFRVSGYVYNRGPRSLALDLACAPGLAAFHRVAAGSDVVIEALRPGLPEKLGIDHDRLVRLRPDIITIGLSAYGEGGPLSERPGVDMVLQGMSGMMSAQGGDDVPVANTMPIIDVSTAAMLALCTTLALYHRQRTGQGQRAWCSLAATATFLQSGELVCSRGGAPPPPGGRDFAGRDPFDRYYRAADGWLRVQALYPERVSAESLRQAGVTIDTTRFHKDPGAAMGEALAGLGVSDAVDALARAEIAAYPARKVSEVIRDPRLVSSEFIHVRQTSDGTPFVTTGRYADFSRTPRFGPMTSPGTGEHSAQVLSEAGLTVPEIVDLSRGGAVVLGAPMEQRLPIAYR
jgi:crotonobetainyl-CoA:carnitine CoA-transferase CaiB-like acyl-CoA transferase